MNHASYYLTLEKLNNIDNKISLIDKKIDKLLKSLLIDNHLNIPAKYIHNLGDTADVLILNYDNKGNAWVKWLKDNFINMVPTFD